MRRRLLPSGWLLAGLAALGLYAGAACQPSPPASSGKPPWKRPRKPGESITHTQLCRCKACDPTSCCRELEQDRPELKECADGYDFSRCALEVSSCDANCFEHSWRIRKELRCEETRPAQCCAL